MRSYPWGDIVRQMVLIDTPTASFLFATKTNHLSTTSNHSLVMINLILTTLLNLGAKRVTPSLVSPSNTSSLEHKINFLTLTLTLGLNL